MKRFTAKLTINLSIEAKSMSFAKEILSRELRPKNNLYGCNVKHGDYQIVSDKSKITGLKEIK